MKIYSLSISTGFEEFQLKNFDEDIEYVESLSDDKPLIDEWKTLEVERITKGKKSDCPFFWALDSAIVISEKARKELMTYFEEDRVELLPITCEGNTYYLLHILDIINVSYDYNLNFGTERFDFILNQEASDEIKKRGLFRGYLQEDRLDDAIFVTEKFINIVKESKLKGFSFCEVYDSEKE